MAVRWRGDSQDTGLGNEDETHWANRLDGNVIGGGQYTFAWWAKLDSVPPTANAHVTQVRDGVAGQLAFYVRRNSSPSESYSIRVAGTTAGINRTVSLSNADAQSWHCGTSIVSHSGGDIIYNHRIYNASGTIVGQASGTVSSGGDPLAVDGMMIGATVTNNVQQYKGDLAEFAFWGRVLSEDQIANLYKGYVQVAGWPTFYLPLYSKALTLNGQVEIGSGVGASTNTRIIDWSPADVQGGYSGLATAPHPPVPSPFPSQPFHFSIETAQTSGVYNIGKRGVLDGSVDHDDDTLKVALFTGSFSYDIDHADVAAVVTANTEATGYTRPTMTTVSVDMEAGGNRVYISADDTKVAIDTSQNVTAVLVYKEGTGDGDSIPLVYYVV